MPSSYQHELNSRRRELRKRIKIKENLVYAEPRKKDDLWFKEYDELNQLRLKLQTVQSRIDNLNNTSYVPDQMNINQ